MADTVILAYSGGLDTSVAIRWLKDTYGLDAVTLTVDVGNERDIPAVALDFQMLAGSVGPSHAYVHVVDFSIPVTIHGMAAKSGDLIHADRHGAVIVPVDKIDAMKGALDGLMQQEARIIAAAKSGQGVEAIKAAFRG